MHKYINIKIINTYLQPRHLYITVSSLTIEYGRENALRSPPPPPFAPQPHIWQAVALKIQAACKKTLELGSKNGQLRPEGFLGEVGGGGWWGLCMIVRTRANNCRYFALMSRGGLTARAPPHCTRNDNLNECSVLFLLCQRALLAAAATLLASEPHPASDRPSWSRGNMAPVSPRVSRPP